MLVVPVSHTLVLGVLLYHLTANVHKATGLPGRVSTDLLLQSKVGLLSRAKLLEIVVGSLGCELLLLLILVGSGLVQLVEILPVKVLLGSEEVLGCDAEGGLLLGLGSPDLIGSA